MIDHVVSGRYRVDGQIGVGGMGIVYRAHDTKLRRDVALKVIAPHLVEDEEARARFLREAQALAGLSHPNIVTVFDLSEESETGLVFIVMELLNGSPLRKRITDPARPTFFDMAIQVCRALEHAHSHGVLHRDIKPENIFVCSDGTVKLMDFGLARLVDGATMASSGMVTGTVSYMSPEQLRGGPVDPRADLYGLGVLFYEYLCGFTPFLSDNPGTVLLKHLTEPPPSLRAKVPTVSDELEALIFRLLAKDPAGRYPSAIILRDSLERICARGTAFTAPLTSGLAMQTASIPLVVPKPKRGYSSTGSLARPYRNVRQNVQMFAALFCVVLLGAILAFAFGETLQRIFVQGPEPAKKTSIAKKSHATKPRSPAAARNRRARKSRRGDSAAPSGAAAPASTPVNADPEKPDNTGREIDANANVDDPAGDTPPDGKGNNPDSDSSGGNTDNKSGTDTTS